VRVLIVSQYFYPENLNINNVAKLLQTHGHSVEVLTGKPNYPSGKYFKGYGFFSKIVSYDDDMTIFRVPILPRGKRFRFIGLSLNYLSFIVSASLLSPFLLRKRNFDIIFVYGTSPILKTIPAIFISKIKRVPLVLWVQDLWPESIVSSGFYLPKFILSFIDYIVRFIYKSCDLILCQSRGFVSEINKKMPSLKVGFLPNTISNLFEDTAKENLIPKELEHIRDTFKIVFTGNIGEAQSLQTALTALSITNKKSSIKFSLILVGSGSKTEELKSLAKKLHLDNVYFLGQHPLNTMPSFIQNSDLLLISLKKARIFQITIPNKLQSYLLSGKPIVGSLDGEGSEIINSSKSGIAVSSEDSEALSDAFINLANLTSKELSVMGDNGLKFFKNNYSDEIFLNSLDKYFEGLV